LRELASEVQGGGVLHDIDFYSLYTYWGVSKSEEIFSYA
jgi:hypothetical protein